MIPTFNSIPLKTTYPVHGLSGIHIIIYNESCLSIIIIPRKSCRRKTIESLQLEIKELKKESILHEIMDEEDSDEDDIYIQKQQLCKQMIRSRYF